MFLAGAKNLEAKKEWINELNVFPVPDGDTGTNMTLTMMSAAKEVSALSNPTMETLSKAISSGSLRGARGNSGVILSQLFRGFTRGIRAYKEIDAFILANAFGRAVETAYKAVMKPKEGTILTVARGVADKAFELVEEIDDLHTFLEAVLTHAELVLSQTPELLPILKEAGVVDSGGQGLVEVLRGAFDAYCGKEVDYTFEAPASSGIVKITKEIEEEIKFGYCTEFIIMTENEFKEDMEMDFKAYLSTIGDSLVVVADDEIVKVHVHTNDPGLALQRALTYGSLSRMKIDNMREEHQEKLIRDAGKLAAAQSEEDRLKLEHANAKNDSKKEVGFISVSIGEGIGEIFKGLGVDFLIEGGQTMNPSTEDMLNAIEQVNASTVFILPNNKNIILAANQAKSLTKDKNVIVIPTNTVPQGITAIVNYVVEKTPKENEANMISEINRVKTGQVTYAVRDTCIGDKAISQGDIIGIGDHCILCVGVNITEVLKDMITQLVDDETELISVYYGEEVCEEEAGKLREELEEKYPDCDVEIHFGGQPIYYYIVSVE